MLQHWLSSDSGSNTDAIPEKSAQKIFAPPIKHPCRTPETYEFLDLETSNLVI